MIEVFWFGAKCAFGGFWFTWGVFCYFWFRMRWLESVAIAMQEREERKRKATALAKAREGMH